MDVGTWVHMGAHENGLVHDTGFDKPLLVVSPELLVPRRACQVVHAEHAEHSQLQQHMLTALLGRARMQEGLKGALPSQEILQICHSGWQNFITVAQIHLGKQNT